MREIKFRALTYERKLIDVWGIQFFTEGSAIVNDEVPAKDLMQYTGLRDKNGKEVYEGDIVRIEEMAISENAKQKQIRGADVVQSNYVGVIEWDNEGADYNCVSDGIAFGFPRHDQKVEVIGNIHENPELLK